MRLLLINFLQALRHIKRNKWQTLLVVSILSFAMAAFVFSAAGIWKVTHEAEEIPDAEDVYAVQVLSNLDWAVPTYRLGSEKSNKLMENIPTDIKVGKLSTSRDKDRLKAICDTTYEHTIATVDPGFFDVMQSEFVYGRPVEKEDEVVLTDKAAIAMFGTDELVGSVVHLSLHSEDNREVPLRVCGIVKEDKLSPMFKFSAYVYRKIEDRIWLRKGRYTYSRFIVVVRTDDAEELQGILDENNTRTENKLFGNVQLIPIGMYSLLERECSFWKAAFYPGVFLILSALLLVSALFSYLALLNTNVESRWTEHRLRLSFGAGSDTVRRIYAEVVLVFLCVGLCTAIILELGYDSFLRYMQMPECDVMQWFVWVWMVMLLFLLILCSIPVCLQHRKYIKVIHGAQQGKSLLLNDIFVTAQVTVSVLLVFLVWNGGRQLKYISDDGLGYNARKVYTLSFTDEKYKSLVNNLEFAHEISSVVAVDTCIMQARFYEVNVNITWVFDGYENSIWPLQLTTAGIRLFEMKPNLWKNAEGDFGMDPNKVLLSTNTAKHFGITPETPFLPNGKEVVGILDICNRDMHYEQYVTAYISYYRPVHKEELYFSFHPGKEKEGIAAVEDLLRRRDINVDAGLVRVVNFGDTIANTYEKEQNYLTLYTILAFVGFGIAFFGLLTLVSADLQRQRRSLAIRRIFGATYGVCLRQTLRLYSIVTTLGTIIGLCIGFYLMTMWLETYTTSITLGWEQPVCIALGIAMLVTSLVSWKVRQCFREKPANVIAN